jgi:hypothetical protein
MEASRQPDRFPFIHRSVGVTRALWDDVSYNGYPRMTKGRGRSDAICEGRVFLVRDYKGGKPHRHVRLRYVPRGLSTESKVARPRFPPLSKTRGLLIKSTYTERQSSVFNTPPATSKNTQDPTNGSSVSAIRSPLKIIATSCFAFSVFSQINPALHAFPDHNSGRE